MVVKTEGDAFFAAFERHRMPRHAVVAAQRALAAEAWPTSVAAPRPDGPPPGRGPASRWPRPGRPRGLRRHRRELRRPHRRRRQRRPDRPVGGARRSALAGWTDDGVRAGRRGAPGRQGLRGAAARSTGSSCSVPPTTPARSARSTRRRTCRATVTPLVGRDAEIAPRPATQLADEPHRHADRARWQRQDPPRARRRARRCALAFPHGTWFVDLAAIRDAALVESTIAATIGVGESSERRSARSSALHLRDRTCCSSSTTSSSCSRRAADIVARLVRAAPSLTTIVTSRELLRIGGERGHPVPPLDIDAGVALFERLAPPAPARPAVWATTPGRPSGRSASGSAACRWPSSSRRLASACMKPAQILQRLGHSLDLSSGARDAAGAAADPAGRDRLEPRPAERRRTPPVPRTRRVQPAAARSRRLQAVVDPEGDGRHRPVRRPRVARRQEPDPRRDTRGEPARRPAARSASILSSASTRSSDSMKRASGPRSRRPMRGGSNRSRRKRANGSSAPRERRSSTDSITSSTTCVPRSPGRSRPAATSPSACGSWAGPGAGSSSARTSARAAPWPMTCWPRRAPSPRREPGSRGSPLTAASPTGWTMSRAPGRATRSALRSPRRPAIRCSSPMRTTTSASPR